VKNAWNFSDVDPKIVGIPVPTDSRNLKARVAGISPTNMN
jgi:hypothetical protein